MITTLELKKLPMACAYCGGDATDRPFFNFAQCWGCYIRDYYKPPMLPWWRVSP